VGSIFPGHGDTSTDSHLELPLSSIRPPAPRVEFAPFSGRHLRLAVQDHDGQCASCQRSTNAVRTLSRRSLTGILRRGTEVHGVILRERPRDDECARQPTIYAGPESAG